MVAGHTVTALTAILQDFIKESFEEERDYVLPFMKDAQKETLGGKRKGYVFDWHKWDEIGLAQKQTYGTDLSSGKTFTITQTKGQLRLMADYISIDPFANDIRLDDTMDAAYRHFKKQVKRTTWEWARGSITVGSGFYDTSAGFAATGSETWTTPTKYYMGGGSRADMIAAVAKTKAKELHALALTLGLYGAPTFEDGTYHLCLSRHSMYALIAEDQEFRQLHEGGKLTVFEEGKLPRWGNFTIYINDMPFREQSSGAESTGSSYLFSSTGDLIFDYAYGPGSFGIVSLGKNGMQPDFKVQDISKVPNSEVTIGWSMPFAAGVIDYRWIIPAASMSTAQTSVSSL